MKCNINKTKKKAIDKRRSMGPDQPFDYDEVASATDPDYVRDINRDGLAFVPYEDVKKNIPGYYLSEDTCVWMRAGIINFRRCDYDFDCYNCPFDQAMKTAIGEKIALEKTQRAESWVNHVKTKYKAAAPPCIHYLSGLISSPEECSGNYLCYQCSVHKLLDNTRHSQAPVRGETINVSGYNMMDDYFYHFGHSWVDIGSFQLVRIGIDDFISKILGPVDEINLPPVGISVKRGEIGCILTRDNKKAPIQAPISGTVYAVNDKVKINPELARNDPFHEGWLYILDAENLKPELTGLYSGQECFQWMEKESQNLYELMGPRYEGLAATGGEPIDDIYGHFPEMDWDLLVRTFLHMAENR